MQLREAGEEVDGCHDEVVVVAAADVVHVKEKWNLWMGKDGPGWATHPETIPPLLQTAGSSVAPAPILTLPKSPMFRNSSNVPCLLRKTCVQEDSLPSAKLTATAEVEEKKQTSSPLVTSCSSRMAKTAGTECSVGLTEPLELLGTKDGKGRVKDVWNGLVVAVMAQHRRNRSLGEHDQ